MNEIREHAVRLLLEVVARAENPAEHADIEAWVEARGEDEGGFLWLAGLLNCQPNQLALGIKTLIENIPAPVVRRLLKRISFDEA